jgi:hypothetical protein
MRIGPSEEIAGTSTSFCETALARLMAVLKHEKERLYQTQKREREQQDYGQPKDCVDPIRRVKRELDKEGPADDDRSYDQNHEDRGPVAGIEHRIVETARGAARRELEVSGEKRALRATRTSTQKSRIEC